MYWRKQSPELFYKRVIFTNFSKFTLKHQCQDLFFKKPLLQVFPVNFPRLVGPLYLQNTFGRLLLHLEPYQLSMIEFFCGNSKSLTVFEKKYHICLKGFKSRIASCVFSWRSFSCIVNKITWRYISSCLQMFLKFGVLKNFANFTGKQQCWNLFSIKLKALRPATLLTRDSNTGVFLWNLWSF